MHNQSINYKLIIDLYFENEHGCIIYIHVYVFIYMCSMWLILESTCMGMVVYMYSVYMHLS